MRSYIGGSFGEYKNISGKIESFAKISLVDGLLDSSYKSTGSTLIGFDGSINSVLCDGENVFVGGLFQSYGGLFANSIAKFNMITWELDTTFNPPSSNGFDGTVMSLKINGSHLYVGGFFSAYRGISNSANGLAKLN